MTSRGTASVIGACLIGLLLFATPVAAAKVGRLLAPGTVCPGQDAAAAFAAQERTMRCMHNYARRKASRARLSDAGTLRDSADKKARDVLQCDQFSHFACGRDFLFWFEQLDYLTGSCWRAGKNLAWGTGPYGTARSIMRSWLRSPGHRANILSGSYDQFGIGLRVGELGGVPDARVWVAHFGNNC